MESQDTAELILEAEKAIARFGGAFETYWAESLARRDVVCQALEDVRALLDRVDEADGDSAALRIELKARLNNIQ